MEASKLKLNDKFINPLGETEEAHTLLARATGDRINEWAAKDCSEIENLSDREKEIQKLCIGVFNMAPERNYNSNGPDDATCPLCYARSHVDAKMEDIKHAADCEYLIAKDLSTNLR